MTLTVQVVVVPVPPEFASISAHLVRNWAVGRYVDWERPIAGAEIEVCYTSGGGCVVHESHSEDRYLMKDLHWGESFTLRARPFNDGGYGPWADVEVHGGAGYSFKIMDNFPLQVLGLPHRGDPWSIAMMMPDVISSRRRPDALLPTNFDSVVNAQTVYADESRGFDAMFGGHPIHFRIEYDSEGDQECMSDEHGLVRLERLAPHVGRLPLAMLQQVDTVRLTNQSAIRTDAWTSMRRRGFIGVNCMPRWEEDFQMVEVQDENGNRWWAPRVDSEFEEILLHEIGHLLPKPGYGVAQEADLHRGRAAGEPYWFVSEYAMWGTHAEPPTETLSAWFVLRCAGQRVAGDGSMVSRWGWGFDDALLESLPNRMAYFDSLFSAEDMAPHMCQG